MQGRIFIHIVGGGNVALYSTTTTRGRYAAKHLPRHDSRCRQYLLKAGRIPSECCFARKVQRYSLL